VCVCQRWQSPTWCVTEAAVVGAWSTHALASLASQTSNILGGLTSGGVRTDRRWLLRLHVFLGGAFTIGRATQRATQKMAPKNEIKKHRGKTDIQNFVSRTYKGSPSACALQKEKGLIQDRPLAYGVVFLRLGGGLGCFSPAIDNYID
jgi:hypothetical protein